MQPKDTVKWKRVGGRGAGELRVKLSAPHDFLVLALSSLSFC